jgi:hypothetical protein
VVISMFQTAVRKWIKILVDALFQFGTLVCFLSCCIAALVFM